MIQFNTFYFKAEELIKVEKTGTAASRITSPEDRFYTPRHLMIQFNTLHFKMEELIKVE